MYCVVIRDTLYLPDYMHLSLGVFIHIHTYSKCLAVFSMYKWPTTRPFCSSVDGGRGEGRCNHEILSFTLKNTKHHQLGVLLQTSWSGEEAAAPGLGAPYQQSTESLTTTRCSRFPRVWALWPSAPRALWWSQGAWTSSSGYGIHS